ncbi:MAG: polyphosphate kinase 1 [Thermoleophilia bacterium]|nr:polyphosphate kinase 1 [Thermoleophilia bacterium]
MTTVGQPVRDLTDPALYVNRELSWLDFNARVLALAADHSQPLLERCKFLSIFSRNLDEFFMVRVAGLMHAIAAGRASSTPDQLPRAEVLEGVRERVLEMVALQASVWRDDVRPTLAAEGIVVANVSDMPRAVLDELDVLFTREVEPMLIPLAVGPGLPFPYVSGLSLNLGLTVRDPSSGESRFARVKVPPMLPRLVRAGDVLVPVEQAIAANLGHLFPGMEITRRVLFRVTRDADLSISDEADDLLNAVEHELSRRRFGEAVRVEVEARSSNTLLEEIKEGLGVTDDQVYPISSLLDHTALSEIAAIDRPDLKDAPWEPRVPARLIDGGEEGGMFAEIRRGDILVHHPYDSFEASVERFVHEAADDPDVVAIEQTLYRTSGDTPIVPALIRAAERGKGTVCLVELTARFDEARNIRWAKALEHAGVHVVYGLPGLKTHAKLCLVVRREGNRLRRYAHIGTGNYHPTTARLYTDVGIFTCREEIVDDVADLFNYLTGFSRAPEYRRALVAPAHLRDQLITCIDRLTERHVAGHPGRIRMNLNSLVDGRVIQALFRASCAGVPVDLVLRGVCGFLPGIPGASENIRVTSVVGRFLEHTRIFVFTSGDERHVLTGSADIMARNLDDRVELIIPVEDEGIADHLVEIVDIMRADTSFAWSLQSDGTWTRVAPIDGQLPFSSQQALMERAAPRPEAGPRDDA